jgi:hypothetical protein
MSRFVRLAFVGIATILPFSPAAAAPVSADMDVPASARILSPLVLEKLSNLDFGRIIIGDVVGTQTVSIDPISGSISGCSNGVTCLGPVQRASFFVHGTPDVRVRIDSNSSNLTNELGDTLVFTPAHPSSTMLLAWPGGPASGRGFFAVGGSITLSATTAVGLYQSTIEVTVDYM